MADDTKLFSIAEEGCLRVSSHIRQVVYHRSLNVLLVLSSNGSREAEIKVVVLDIASGTILHDTRLSLPPPFSPGSQSLNQSEAPDSVCPESFRGNCLKLKHQSPLTHLIVFYFALFNLQILSNAFQ